MPDRRFGPAPSRRLPEQPNLEQLKRQAKDLLRQYRSGDPGAVAEINQFEQNAKRSEFALNDAQRVIARSYGFASWPKLKAFVDGARIACFGEAVQNGDMSHVRSMLASCPELVHMDRAGNDEHRAIHYAVLQQNLPMVRLLMEAGSDARKGIFPHRDATTALQIAQDRGYPEIVAAIEEEERHRREEMSCTNATVSPVQDQISRSISEGDEGRALRLLEADLSQIHACDRNGRTPLHIAAEETNVQLVAWLLKWRANPHKQDPDGYTPLDLAALAADPRNDCARSFPATAKLLLDHGAELTVRAAVALGDELLVRNAVAADPRLLRQISKSGGLLSLAVNHQRLGMVRLLLDLGADVNERITLEELEEPTESWGMPLWYAALAGDFATTQLLLDRGADPNANVYASGWPLRNAWNHPDDSVKKLLLARGAKLQLYMVSETHNVPEARNRLAQGLSEEDVHELLWSAADSGCAEIVELALAHLNWPANDPRWHWVLIQPVRGAGGSSSENEGHFRSMESILRHGVDPNVSRFGQTALHFTAARRSDLSGEDKARFASMLIDYGADLSRRDDLLQSTALGWACRWGERALVETLLLRGAPVHEVDAEPWATPMAWAAKGNHPEIVELLKKSAGGCC